MSDKHENKTAESTSNSTGKKPNAPDGRVAGASKPKEIGGRDGPDPTRYGDWEKAGRCIDF